MAQSIALQQQLDASHAREHGQHGTTKHPIQYLSRSGERFIHVHDHDDSNKLLRFDQTSTAAFLFLFIQIWNVVSLKPPLSQRPSYKYGSRMQIHTEPMRLVQQRNFNGV